MGSTRPVCLVVGEGADIGALSRSIDSPVEVTDPDDLMITLCRSAVTCVVVPAGDGESLAANVAYAVGGLFPDLPVVVFGPDPPETDEAVTVTADALGDEAVVSTVREEVEAGAESDAARPPSRPETLLASMFEAFPAHLYVKDRSARHLMTSDEILDPSDLLGLTDLETLDSDESADIPNYQDDLRVIDRGERVIEIDEYAAAKDLFFRTSKVPWQDSSGDVIGLAGMTQDITEFREQKKELRQQNRRLRKVALMTAHELRNELQIVGGQLSRIEANDESVAAMETSVDRVVRIVDKIVSLATSNEREPEATTLWLSALVHDVWEAIAVPDATLSVENDRRLLGPSDATHLLVEMLLDNAIVHGGTGVTIEVAGTDSGFYVADDGPGVEIDPPSKVLEAGVTTEENKSGFGLYIARQVADEQGWRIAVADSEDGGARFEILGVEQPGEQAEERE